LILSKDYESATNHMGLAIWASARHMLVFLTMRSKIDNMKYIETEN